MPLAEGLAVARGAAAEERLALTCTAHRAVRFMKHDLSQMYANALVGWTIRFVGVAVLCGAMFYNLGLEVMHSNVAMCAVVTIVDTWLSLTGKRRVQVLHACMGRSTR